MYAQQSEYVNRAVFLDRDGTINMLIFSPATNFDEGPKTPDELKLYDFSIASLKKLQDAGYFLFLVSNQPDYAKGKATMESIKAVHEKFDSILKSNGINFKEYYYCYHDKKGVVKEYAIDCECRKPKPFFLLKAAKSYDLDLQNSWMVGDYDRDVECGQAAGVKTVLIEEPSSGWIGKSKPDYKAKNLKEAVEIILKQ